MQQDSEALSLEQALGILRRRVPLIVLCVVIVAGAAYGYSKHQTKKYTATASLAFSYNSLSQQIAGLPANSGNLLAQEASNLELVKLGDMAAKTASQLGHGLTEEKVASSLSISGEGESSVVDVSATATSPTLAAAIANTYTHQFVTEQQRANRQYFKSALALVNKQLAALSRAQRLGQDGVELQDRAQTLGLLAELNYGNVQIAEVALPPTTPSSPKTSRNTALGLFLGLLIGLGLAFMLERVDRRIKGPGDLEKIYDLPMLGVVPNSAALSGASRRDGGERIILPPAVAESFNLIRAHLRFFNLDRNLRTIVIASPASGDGKTTIARHLAEAAASLGSRVLLLEVDLRHPTLAQQFDIRSGPGLADVLIGATSMGAAIRSVDLEALPGEGAKGRTLDVLATGAVLPPNPGELIESHAMDAVLERAKSAYDLVVVDTPPLAAVSDAFPLLTKVDGVVIVGWVGRSRRDAAERLHQVLASSGAPLLGVIANGTKTGGSYAYAQDDDKAPLAVTSSANGASSSSPEEFAPTVRA
ncbi:MAG TPA: polysaccharide biosynthesis tyrosine autokinase [Solirubrobacteraceae bacterium]|nr:polysaccharide biosynthesis tyrosine autokinase [Solirubrobacteraceae bacterium]